MKKLRRRLSHAFKSHSSSDNLNIPSFISPLIIDSMVGNSFQDINGNNTSKKNSGDINYSSKNNILCDYNNSSVSEHNTIGLSSCNCCCSKTSLNPNGCSEINSGNYLILLKNFLFFYI